MLLFCHWFDILWYCRLFFILVVLKILHFFIEETWLSVGVRRLKPEKGFETLEAAALTCKVWFPQSLERARKALTASWLDQKSLQSFGMGPFLSQKGRDILAGGKAMAECTQNFPFSFFFCWQDSQLCGRLACALLHPWAPLNDPYLKSRYIWLLYEAVHLMFAMTSNPNGQVAL